MFCMTNIQCDLFSMQDKKYGAFTAKLMPNIQSETVIGVRTPTLRKYARNLPNDLAYDFITKLPHQYFEENQLHSFILSDIKNFEVCITMVDKFLPYIDNWATCDSMIPKSFKKHRQELLTEIERWLSSQETYTLRFGIKMLMT